MKFLSSLTLLLVLTGAARAQTVTQFDVRHFSGQSYVTWTELNEADVRYRVYRSSNPIMSASDLDASDLLGEVDQDSSVNQRRSLAGGVLRHWVVPFSGTLPSTRGLFVHTTESLNAAWYAVTSVRSGVEDRTINMGSNASSGALVETPAEPQPIFQANLGSTILWAHWVSDRDTPFQEAMALEGSSGFNFTLRTAVFPGFHGLVVRFHDQLSNYSNAWPPNTIISPNLHVLSMDDSMYGASTHWFGVHDGYPAPAQPTNVVRTLTLKRVEWTLDWSKNRLVNNLIDNERIYAVGVGMGACGALRLCEARPQEIAAAFLLKPAFDLGAADIADRTQLDAMWGSPALNLPTDRGPRVYHHLDAAAMATDDPSQRWPILRTISGRFDDVSGWSAAPDFFDRLAIAGRTAAHYFDFSTQSGISYWTAIENILLQRTFDERLSKPSLAFSELGIDDDAGDGTADQGDLIGAVGAYIDFDRALSEESQDHVQFQVALRNESALDDAPTPLSRVRLTPLGSDLFQLLPGQIVDYTLHKDGVLVDNHLLWADGTGHTRTPLVPMSQAAHTARFERFVAPQTPHMFVGQAPSAGEKIQVVLFGQAGDLYRMAWSVTSVAPTNARWRSDPRSTYRPGSPDVLPTFTETGIIGSRGYAELQLELPRHVRLPGTQINFRATVADRFTNPATISLR